jgi:hypothetical protein
MVQSATGARALHRAALVVACVLAALPRAHAQPAASGHFRFASIHWEKQEGATAGAYPVKFTIRSSWLASYGPFHNGNPVASFDEATPLLLVGAKTPTFTIVTEPANVTHSVLGLTITQQSHHPYEMGGDWVNGETIIQHTYTTPGPHRAVFSGCCRVNRVGGEGDFELEVSVDLSDVDFSPAIPVVPGALLGPGDAISFPAMHPKGNLDPRTYTWTVLRTVDLVTGKVHPGVLPAGVTMQGGVLAVASSGAVKGMYQVEVDVGVHDTDSASCVIQLLNITTAAPPRPTFGPTTPAARSGHSMGTADQEVEFRTGFRVELRMPFSPAGQGSTMHLQIVGDVPAGMTSSVEDVEGSHTKHLKMLWDKPCWHQGQARLVVACVVVTEVPTDVPATEVSYVRRSTQACLHLHILEDESPMFTEPAADEEFHWEMGRTSSFMIKVADHALLDTVSRLDLSSATALPTAMVLSDTVISGNMAERRVTWEPLPSAGGGDYKLCFETADTPGMSYERCRLGTREATRCVTVIVARCRYIVRAREALNDVAAHFHTDWIQLWALNPELTRPDLEVGYNADSSALGATLKTGHLYQVDRGDYLSAIAYKFGTSVKMLLFLNADLLSRNQDEVLEIGKKICIIPDSCLRD